ncbi:hypothetical protein INR49_006383 [Caranx melampygus]|nr:hypothetical protein INR49_006383 [Caranx melampygus]
MSSFMEYAFPAGEERDASDEEWDVDCCQEDRKSSHVKYVDAVVPEDNVSVLKKAISGMDVETRLSFDWTPLMGAVSVANYDLAKLLLDRGARANFSKDNWTVLMASCTAPASEDKVARCVELLLSRNADVHMTDRSQMTCLMLAAREGYSKVINLLLSRGANINAQDVNGYTALSIAAQCGREEAVLKLLQLGADKTIRTKSGQSPVDLAHTFKHTQIVRILTSSPQALDGASLLKTTSEHPSSMERTGTTSLRPVCVCRPLLDIQCSGPVQQVLLNHCSTRPFWLVRGFILRNESVVFKSECELSALLSAIKLDDLELLLHGLNLGYLADTMTVHLLEAEGSGAAVKSFDSVTAERCFLSHAQENDITWSYLLTMEKEDLEKIGITNPEHQQRLLSALQQMHLDTVDLDTIRQLGADASGYGTTSAGPAGPSEDLHNFLISVQQQCCYLTETIHDIINRFPRHTSQLVFSVDPNKEAQTVCNKLVIQTKDLQKEVTCLHDLIGQLNEAEDCCRPPRPGSRGNRRMRYLKRVVLSAVGATVFMMLYKAACWKVYLPVYRRVF